MLDDPVNRSAENHRSESLGWAISAEIIDQAVEVEAAAEAGESGR
jgi:hypothetical protein